MYLFVPCDKKSHRTEISFPIHSNHLSHPHPPQHLDLLGISQNVFTTARFNICIDAMKKNSNALTLELVTRSILK